MADTIKALRLNGTEYINPGKPDGPITRNLAVEQVTLPEPQEGEVIVEPMFVGICGSDNSASTGKPNFTWVERPRTIGHEASGRVVGFGPNTEGKGGLKIGDVVCLLGDEFKSVQRNFPLGRVSEVRPGLDGVPRRYVVDLPGHGPLERDGRKLALILDLERENELRQNQGQKTDEPIAARTRLKAAKAENKTTILVVKAFS